MREGGGGGSRGRPDQAGFEDLKKDALLRDGRLEHVKTCIHMSAYLCSLLCRVCYTQAAVELKRVRFFCFKYKRSISFELEIRLGALFGLILVSLKFRFTENLFQQI